MKKHIIHFIEAVGIVLTLMILTSVYVMAEEPEISDSAANEPEIIETRMSVEDGDVNVMMFIKNIDGNIVSSEAYVDTIPVEITECGELGRTNNPNMRTLIMVDNSKSVGTSANAEKIKAIISRLIWNHFTDEEMAVKTFGMETEEIVDFTTNYDQIRSAVEKIEYYDQNTALRNALYDEVVTINSDNEKDFERIIVFTDGTDDSQKGVSYEELLSTVTDENLKCPIFVICSDYKKSEEQVDKAYYLARLTGGDCFGLDEYEDAESVTEIADAIENASDNITYCSLKIPKTLRTGMLGELTVAVATSDDEYTFKYSIVMPQYTIDELRQLNEEKPEENVMKEEENQQTTPIVQSRWDWFRDTVVGKQWLSITILLIAVGLIVFASIFILRYRKKEEPIGENGENDSDVINESLEKQSQSDSQFIIVNMDNLDEKWCFDTTAEIVIGRSTARCDIAFENDKTLASRHAHIIFKAGMAYISPISDNADIIIKDTRLESEHELRDNEIIRIGKEKLQVYYE